jgi:multidrug efflux system membrane fusion protein
MMDGCLSVAIVMAIAGFCAANQWTLGGAVAMAAEGQQLVPVYAAEARRADVPIYVTGLGTVRAYNSVTVTSRVDGQIVKINFAEGQEVHSGDVLVEIDPQPFQAALAQAKAAKLRNQALLSNARLDLDRAQKLVGTGAGTTQQLDTAKSQVAQLEASTASDQAAIDAAQTQLNYCTIRAPISGRTGTRLIDQGNIVRGTNATAIVMINQIHPISVDFDLRADILPEIRQRMKTGDLPATAFDRDDHELQNGKLTVIDNQVNTSTGTIRLKATFDNSDESLWPGQFVTIRLQLEVRHDAITVPPTAVLRGPDGTYVFVVDESRTIRKKPIKVGLLTKDVAVIDDGLVAGEQVVTEGQYRIQAGSLVNVIPTPDQPMDRKGT